jgi:hypothetical protein
MLLAETKKAISCAGPQSPVFFLATAVLVASRQNRAGEAKGSAF